MSRALAFVLALFMASLGQAAERFAIVAGSNEGAPGRPRLWFARKDAARLAAALRELGDFPSDHVVLLEDAKLQELRRAFATMEERMAGSRGAPALLLFFFSGHADPAGLELGPERLSFSELRELVVGSRAEVKVAIVDACDSGTLTQVKGAHASSTIDFPLPSDESVTGVAFLASTAVDEPAQESSALQGSFFSHHLEAALRGAADADEDGQVTLSEAFRYTAARTVAETAVTEVGVQHPTFSVRTSGRGDVVLAHLRRAQARLLFPPDISARYLLRGPSGLVADLAGAHKPIVLALPAGTYTVERHRKERRETGEVRLEPGSDLKLPELSPAAFSPARRKGGSTPWELRAAATVRNAPLPNFGVAPGVRLGLRRSAGPVDLRLRVDYAGKSVGDEALHYRYHLVEASLGVSYPLWDAFTRIEVGVEGGGGWVLQQLAGGGSRSSGQWLVAAVAFASWRVGPLRLGLEGSAGAAGIRVNDLPRTGLLLQGALSVALPL